MWIDTHAHLDAPEFDDDRDAVLARAQAAGVGLVVLPAVAVAHLAPLQAWAQRHRQPYALGIHPLFAHQATADDLQTLARALDAARDDPLLVAVGEIGVDVFVPGLDLAVQQAGYREGIVTDEFRVETHPRAAGEQAVVGIAFQLFRRGGG